MLSPPSTIRLRWRSCASVSPDCLVAGSWRCRTSRRRFVPSTCNDVLQVMFAIRKDGFKEHPSVIDDLALVDESDQFTHMLTLDDDNIKALESEMNVFRVDPDFQQSEENYKKIKKGI